MLRGFMQNHAGPKNMCKKTRKTGTGQSSMGGVYLASRLQKCQSTLTQLINIPHSNVFLTCLISCVDGA
jgi:hypothetical protein